MRRLAAFRIALATATWFAPRRLSRLVTSPSRATRDRSGGALLES
jgi:hypothetical protein